MVTREGGASDVRCAECGRVLMRDNEERRWARCRFCGKPVCFDCIRYIGTTIRGAYMDYVEAIRTCGECYVNRG